MPKVLSIREETSEEKKLREWFETQALESPKNLEEAARLLIGLVTGLLGALFGVLTVSAETLPAYLSLSAVKGCGILAVVLWLLSLLCALVVVTPRRWQSDAGVPETQSEVFKAMLGYKSRWLRASVVLFGGAVMALGVVLVMALASIK
jgi:high-affinity Fe2+/Pb2+ permease